MKPEQVKEARNLLHRLDEVDREISLASRALEKEGSISITVELPTINPIHLFLKTTDANEHGFTIPDLIFQIFEDKRNGIVASLKKLGVDI